MYSELLQVYLFVQCNVMGISLHGVSGDAYVIKHPLDASRMTMLRIIIIVQGVMESILRRVWLPPHECGPSGNVRLTVFVLKPLLTSTPPRTEATGEQDRKWGSDGSSCNNGGGCVNKIKQRCSSLPRPRRRRHPFTFPPPPPPSLIDPFYIFTLRRSAT